MFIHTHILDLQCNDCSKMTVSFIISDCELVALLEDDTGMEVCDWIKLSNFSPVANLKLGPV